MSKQRRLGSNGAVSEAQSSQTIIRALELGIAFLDSARYADMSLVNR